MKVRTEEDLLKEEGLLLEEDLEKSQIILELVRVVLRALKLNRSQRRLLIGQLKIIINLSVYQQ